MPKIKIAEENLMQRVYFPAEIRVAQGDGEPTRIYGYAALFDSFSVDLGGFREKIQRGTFLETIASDDIRALFNHDPNLILGRNKSGTLRLSEDETGLAYEIQVPATQAGRDLVESIRRGDITQNSFGFRVLPDGAEWKEEADGTLIRILKKVKLYDISPVTYPAYPDTELALREEMLGKARERLTESRELPQKGRSVALLKRVLDLTEMDR
jgi:HK97 family phage prohead protease